ncbi:hypothetical protein NC653_030010 [Populus alba x Populus x berolinensis]|uniref:Uncharacterized protein n=1 Tax=Populus alba x Populus x berolinensis TaxID=444605 RepID=A0AAD6M3I5_9ROSI|nr:hypothetical protein NC653_030010 [Populus alba x Populus x berolinensis]
MTTITSVLPGLLFFLYFLIAKSHADNIGAATPPPPPPPPLSTVSPPEGSVEFPDALHSSPMTPRIKAVLQIVIPKNVKPFAEVTRRPNCNGIGAACYDPRFVGGDGVMFYFHGKTNEHFSLRTRWHNGTTKSTNSSSPMMAHHSTFLKVTSLLGLALT